MPTLIFKAADVMRVVLHTLTAKAHQEELIDYGKDGEGVYRPGSPKLLLVHDHGVYLVSNGQPKDLIKVRSPNGLHIIDGLYAAYAKGCDPAKHPDTWWDTSRALVGGDDFVEYLPWAEAVREMIDNGANEIKIGIGPNRLELLVPKPRKNSGDK
jgi:hypothetical protein